MKTFRFLGIAALLGLLSSFAAAVSPTAEEMAQSRKWAAAKFEGKIAATDPYAFFSFTYDGRPSAELLPKWEFKRASRALDDNRTEYTLTYTDPKTGLVVRCVGVEFRDFPSVEWTLYFKNTSDKDTPILADIQAIDTPLRRGDGRGIHAAFHQGRYCTSRTATNRLRRRWDRKSSKQMAPAGGRPTNGAYPYWNFETAAKVFSSSWVGRANGPPDLSATKRKGLRIRAGQELTHFKLLPGEEVRSPLVVRAVL